MRRVGRAEGAALRRDAIVVWRYPWLGSATSGAILAGTAAHICLLVRGTWEAATVCGGLSALAVFAFWRSSSVALLVDSLLVSGPVRRRLVSLTEIARIEADEELTIEVDGGAVASCWRFDGASILGLFGVRTRAQWIADQIRGQAEGGGNYAIAGVDGRGLRDLWPWRRGDIRLS